MHGEAALVLRIKAGDPAVALPQLYDVAVNELLCALAGIVLCLANQVDPSSNAPVGTDDVGLVLMLHGSSSEHPLPVRILELV
ncbi:hypothetical protein J6500_19915 [Bradyrhizobium sp. WSM 1704]|uniref:hypothetical protein n=1 Tax=Bradyrhizobium semiaridum TaxID=2821404 RepID=UPI001CE36370|nr:hypothetical protein [Bradyrhizobium semiaridum]MCA6124142.1 hypothetical protein [Bradyrhizobium semiaridum]